MRPWKFITTGIVGVLYFLLYQIWLPTLSLAHFDGFVFFAIGIIALGFLIGVWKYESNDELIYDIPLFTFLSFFVLTLLIAILFSTPLFCSNTLYNQLGKVDDKSFTKDIVEIDTSQIPIVDIDYATKLADKRLGEELALGSQMEVGTFTNKQSVNNHLYYIAPLEHSSFFRWNANKNGTIGYVKVNATNSNDVELVRNVDGNQLNLKYLRSAYFADDLKRHIRNSGYRTIALGEFSFEIDDSGRPYWIIPTYKNTNLWNNPSETGIILCDAQTGECTFKTIEEADEWIDIVIPEYFVKKQIKNWGKYVHGLFNFSHKDQLKMTDHMTTVFNNGECYYYTGLTSHGADNGTVGFIMVNSRNKSATLYRMTGATEAAAMSSAEGKVTDLQYISTVPIPLNISGIPSYFATLKDKEGLVKQYAIINIEHYEDVAIGSTILEAKRQYINLVNNSSKGFDFGDKAFAYTKTGTVTRFASNVEQGSSYYYMVLDNDQNKIYVASYMISDELPLTQEGDIVDVSFVDEKNGTINIVTFDNKNLSITTSKAQEELNQINEDNNIINNDNNNIIKVNPDETQNTWDNLSDEEKAELLEKAKKD